MSQERWSRMTHRMNDLKILVDSLACDQLARRRQAAQSLAKANARPVEAAVALVRAAGDCDDEVRMWAAEALEMMGCPRTADTAALSQLLIEGRDGEVSYWAATLLGRLGPSAASAVDPLTTTLRHSPYLPVRERAAWALGRIGPAARSAAPVLRIVSAEGLPRLSRLAMSALESIRGMAA